MHVRGTYKEENIIDVVARKFMLLRVTSKPVFETQAITAPPSALLSLQVTDCRRLRALKHEFEFEMQSRVHAASNDGCPVISG